MGLRGVGGGDTGLEVSGASHACDVGAMGGRWGGEGVVDLSARDRGKWGGGGVDSGR